VLAAAGEAAAMARPPAAAGPSRALRLVCWLAGIPRANLHDARVYASKLRACGFERITVEDVTPRVFAPYARFCERQATEFGPGCGGGGGGGSGDWDWSGVRTSGWLMGWLARRGR
jgi:hypothetical protein